MNPKPKKAKPGKQSAMLRKVVEAAGLPTRNGDYRGGVELLDGFLDSWSD